MQPTQLAEHPLVTCPLPQHPNIDAAVLHAAGRMESQRSAACQASIDALHAHVEAATLEAAAEAEAAAKTSAEVRAAWTLPIEASGTNQPTCAATVSVSATS